MTREAMMRTEREVYVQGCTRNSNHLAERAVLDGAFIPCNSEAGVQNVLTGILHLIKSSVKAEDIIARAKRYLSDEAKLQGVSINEICGMKIIAIAIFDPQDNELDLYEDFGRFCTVNVEEHPYVFCWCENLDVPDFSEFGDIYLDRKDDGTLYRVCS